MSAPSTWQTSLVEVADGVFAYIQATGGLCISNAGLIVSEDDALVIDTLFTPSMNRDFHTQIRRVTSRPLRHLINTHHHVDHTLGNALFPESRIISHRKARLEMQRVGMPMRPLRQLVPHFAAEIEDLPLRLPDITFDGSMEFHLGDHGIQLLHLGTGHSLGDVLVCLPAERVLFAGDVAFFNVTPVAFEGHISRWIRVADRVAAMDVDVIVPGHGPVGGREDLRLMRDYLALVRRHARRAFAAGEAAEDAARSLRLGEYAAWGEPERALLNVQRLYQEFGGEI
jgi:glyoxylase-like metal-dependent hydrolase (beta-lactamase superfamily II)